MSYKFNPFTSNFDVVGSASGGTGDPGGSTTQVQFNDSGAFGGDSTFTFNKTTDTLTVANLSATGNTTLGDAAGDTLTINAGTTTFAQGTANGVAYLNGSKVLTTGSALTFDGSYLALTGTGNIARFGNGTDAFNLRFRGGNNWSIQYTPSTDEWALQRNSANQYSVNGSSHIWAFPASDGMRLTTKGLLVGYTDDSSLSGTGNAIFSGNVGIGTSSPQNKFVVSNGGAEGLEVVPNASGAPSLIAYNRGTASYIPLRFNGSEQVFQTSGSEKMRLDSSGNLGLGVTPSAWVGFKSIDFSAVSYSDLGNIRNAFWNGSSYIYRTTAAAAQYQLGSNGAHYWNTAPSGTAGNALSFVQAMTLDASGNLGVGQTSPVNKIDILSSGSYSAAVDMTTAQLRIKHTTFPVQLYAGVDHVNRFAYMQASESGVGYRNLLLQPAGGEVLVGGTTDNGAYNLQCNGTAVWGAGAYVNGSDERIKENIVPMASSLDVIRKLNPVTYNYKESWSTDRSTQTGFIAQDLQIALADEIYLEGVVQQGPEYMSVAYQNIIPILTKAIQELHAEIETLKQRIA